METPQTPEELQFAENVEKLKPILTTLNDLLGDGRVTLKSQKYRIENNHLRIVDQEKKISENQVLIEEVNKRAQAIISVAEEKAKEVDSNMRARVASINHMEREAKEKLAEADKILWNAKDKKAVKA